MERVFAADLSAAVELEEAVVEGTHIFFAAGLDGGVDLVEFA